MQKIDRPRTLTRQEIQKVRFVFAPTHPCLLAALDYRNNDLFWRYIRFRGSTVQQNTDCVFIGLARHLDCPAADPE